MPAFKEITADRYDEFLNIMPPVAYSGKGFMVGEAVSHRQCRITQVEDVATFAAFVRIGGKHFEADESMTIAEFRALDPMTVLRPSASTDKALPRPRPV